RHQSSTDFEEHVMSRKLASIVAIAAVCAAGVRSADAQRPQGRERQQYSVVASEETFILVDQRSGQTWLLAQPPAGGTPAWVPIQRIDNPEEAEHWREEQHTRAEQRQREHHEQQQHEMRERLEGRRREMEERRGQFEERARREREEREQRNRVPTESQEPEDLGVREHLRRLGEQTHRAMAESLRGHRERLVEQFGEDHPAVNAISKQIEQLSRELKKLTDDADPSAKLGGDAGSPPKAPLKKQPDPNAKDAEHTVFASKIKGALSQLME